VGHLQSDHHRNFWAFDSKSIDLLNAWAETPAMWLEIYAGTTQDFSGHTNCCLNAERLLDSRLLRVSAAAQAECGIVRSSPVPALTNSVSHQMRCIGAIVCVLKLPPGQPLPRFTTSPAPLLARPGTKQVLAWRV
jgi:hypothetical protein